MYFKICQELPEKEYGLISNKLVEMVKENVTVDPDKWDSYCLLPIQVVNSPRSDFYELFSDSIPANLDYLVEKQTTDGCWEPTWAWGQFEEEWENSESGVERLFDVGLLESVKGFRLDRFTRGETIICILHFKKL